VGYQGGFFRSFEDYESWEIMDPNFKPRLDGYLAGKEIQEEMNNGILAAEIRAIMLCLICLLFPLNSLINIYLKNFEIDNVFLT